MSDFGKKQYTHLTLEDRQEIMECLDKNISFKNIARRVKKSATTISREVKKRFTVQPLSVARTKVDGTPIDDRPCPELLKAPFVCNPCKKRRGNCAFQKQLYIAKDAHAKYETLLVESREGIPLTKEEFWNSDAIIAEGIKKGQHLYHIMESNDIAFSNLLHIGIWIKDIYLSANLIFQELLSLKRENSKDRILYQRQSEKGGHIPIF